MNPSRKLKPGPQLVGETGSEDTAANSEVRTRRNRWRLIGSGALVTSRAIGGQHEATPNLNQNLTLKLL